MSDFIAYNHYVHHYDEQLRAEYAERNTGDIAGEVQRNYYTVSRKAKRMGLQKSDEFMRSSWAKGRKPMVVKGEARKRFKAAADAYMKERFSDTSNKELAALFGVDEKTVRRWARRLGLVKTEAFMLAARGRGIDKIRQGYYTPDHEAWRERRIREVYPDGTEEELLALAEELAVGRQSLPSLARKYGIFRSEEKVREAKANLYKNKTKYGPGFIAALADYYPTHSTKECVERFGVKACLIIGIASRNGIKKTRERRAQSQRERWRK